MIKYLKSLFCKVIKYETTDINGKKTQTKVWFYLSRLIYLIIAMTCYIFLFKDGFSESFIGIYANILAILIGLFSASMIFGFESLYSNNKKDIEGKYEITVNDVYVRRKKIYIVNNEVHNSNDSRDNVLSYIQQNNYANRFICFTGYNIVLCTITLFLILFVSLFELDVYDPFNTYFVNIKSVEWEHVVNLIIGMLISFQRVFVLYAMGLIVKYTLSATISLLHVMTVKMKKG